MNAIGNTIAVLLKRPFLILFSGILILVFSLVNYYNPINAVFPLMFGFGQLSAGNIYESIINLFHFVVSFITDANLIMRGLLYLAVLVAAAAVFAGLVLSGYFNIVVNTLDRKPRVKGDFREGIRKYFVKMSAASLVIIVLSIIFVLFMLIASVPSLIITKAASTGKPDTVFPAVLIDALTAGVLFFGLLFFRTYLCFWFIEIISTGKKAFVKGKQLADYYFWKITGRFVIFDLIYFAVLGMLTFAGYSITSQGKGNSAYAAILFVLKWLFNTVFFSAFITYFIAFNRVLKGKAKRMREGQGG